MKRIHLFLESLILILIFNLLCFAQSPGNSFNPMTANGARHINYSNDQNFAGFAAVFTIVDILRLVGPLLIGLLFFLIFKQLRSTSLTLGGGGILLAIAWGYQLFTGKDGMGGGDIKLLAMIGAFLGWKGVFFTVLASSFIGTVVGIGLMVRAGKGMKMALPFGPFLAIGAILYIFFGPQLITWYFQAL